MALLQIIGIVTIAWIAVSALIVSVTASAGRADAIDRRLRLAARAALAERVPETRSTRARTRFVRRSQQPARSADRQSSASVRAAIR
jgi:hypothetical protein